MITIKKLTDKDLGQFIELIRVFENVFEMENFSIPSNEHLNNVLLNTNFIVVVALDNNRVIAGLTAYVLDQYYSKKPLAYIYDLAVKTDFQRQGIGKKLVTNFKSYCNDKGFKEVFVQADKIDDYAIEFYRSTKGKETEVVHFTYFLNGIN